MADPADETECSVTVTYADTTATTFVEGMYPIQMDGTNFVTILPAPASGTRRVVKSVMFFNDDTMTHTVTLYLTDNSTNYPITKITLPPGSSWASDDQTGVNVGGAVTDGSKGDISVSNGGDTWTIANSAVTLAKMADLPTDRLIGRDTAGTGVPEAISVGGGVEFTGSGSIRVGAFSGEVGKTAGDSTLTITNGAVVTARIADSAVTPAKMSSVAQGLGSRNRLINGDFGVANRAMLVSTVATFSSTTRPANIDNQYTLDRWILLSNADNSAIVTRASDAPTGQFTSCGLQVVGGTNKFGILQIIEQRNCVGLVGQPCTLSFKARYTGSNANTANLRAAIVAWTGTADQPTRDIVSNWNNGIGGSTSNPTLVTSWEYVNTSPASLGISTTWTSYVIANVTIPSNATNVGVFLWSNATSLTANDYIYITDVQLEAGATATAFERLSPSAQQVLCAYYLQMISDVKVNALNGPQVLGYSLGSICDIPVRYNRVIRVPPTLILNGAVWSNTGGEPAGNTFTFFVPNVVAFATTTGTITFAVQSSTAIGALLRVNSTAAFSVAAGNIINLTCGTTVNIYLDAEL